MDQKNTDQQVILQELALDSYLSTLLDEIQIIDPCDEVSFRTLEEKQKFPITVIKNKQEKKVSVKK